MYPVKRSTRTRNRRKKRQLAALLLCACILLGVSVLISRGGAADVPQYLEQVVQPGDTLWGIARSHLPAGMDIREYIYEIKKANGLTGSIIHPGQVLLLPT